MNKTERYVLFIRNILLVMMLAWVALFSSCDFFSDFFADGEKEKDDDVSITSLRLSSSSVQVQVGSISYLSWTVTPAGAKIKPELKYDEDVIQIESENSGIIIKGLKEGETALTVSYKSYSATAIVKVQGYSPNYVDTSEPYIVSDTQVMNIETGSSEMVSVSLFNGKTSDITGFTWSIDKPSVAELEPTGQYCRVKGKSQGVAQITVTHKNTSESYCIGLYVFDDITKATYITTKYNLTTLKVKDGDKTISCDLINPAENDYKARFNWSIKSVDGKAVSEAQGSASGLDTAANTSGAVITDSEVLSITSNANECILTPKKEGVAEIQITHPEAPYPLSIKVRVIEIVENVYIEPSASKIELSGKGKNKQTVTMTLKGIQEGAWNPDDFSYSVYQDDKPLEAGSEDGNVIWYSWGNNITFTGVHDGAVVVYVTHPCAQKRRQLLVLCQDQIKDAQDVSVSINTTQDYIKTKIGAEDTVLKVSLQGGIEGDENDFTWSIKNEPDDKKSKVISCRTSYGSIDEAIVSGNDDSEPVSRMAGQTYSDALLYITPISEGSATIIIGHKKSYYSREVTVKVLGKDSVLETPYYFRGDGIVRFLNSATYRYTAKLVGAAEKEKAEIEWKSDSPALSIISDGENAELSSTATGKNIFHLSVSHKKAEGSKEIVVLTADTQEDLDSMQAFYSDKSYYSLDVGKQTQVYASTIGFDTVNVDPENPENTETVSFDWQAVKNQVTWESSDYGIAAVEKHSENPLAATVSGIKEGTAKITIRYQDTSFTWTIRVYPVKISGTGENGNGTTILTKQLYFTGDGIIRFLNSETYRASVRLVGASETEKSKITWKSDNPKLVVHAVGETAELESKASGQNISHITVEHEEAEGSKEILVLNADTQEELNSMKAFYADKTSYTLTKGKTLWIYADSVGFTDSEGNPLDFASVKDDVEWKSLDESVCTVLKDASNPLNALVTGISEGSTKLTLSYQGIKMSFTVTVYSSIVSTHEKIDTVWLSVYSNVVVLKADESRELSVTPYGIEPVRYSEIEWVSKNPEIVSVIQNGEKSTVTAKSEGETEIWVSHPESENKIKFHVRVGSEYVLAESKPVIYIATNTDVIAMLKDSQNMYELNAVLANTNSEDNLEGFEFFIENTVIANIQGYPTGKAYVKALNAGQTEITVTHSKAKYPKKILVVIANTAEELSAYTYLSTTQNVVNIGESSTETIKVSVQNASEQILDGFLWQMEDDSIASIVKTSANQALIRGNKIGTTRLLVSNSKLTYSSPLEIIIQIVDTKVLSKNPYILANPPIVTLVEGGGWTNLSATLQGGSEDDSKDFTWSVSDPSVLDLYGQNGTARVKAKKSGTALVRIMHPKANYHAQIRCICEEASKADTVISLSCPSVISLKPDDGDYTITANLVNGSSSGRYKFIWSLSASNDGNTNPVVEIIDSENTAIITPKREGYVRLTVTNAEALDPKEITIKVQQFENFSFGKDYLKITQGKTTFLQMEVPATSEECIVSYSVKDDGICSVSGTNAVCELKGISPGSTSIYATLKSKKSETELSKTEMLVNVEESAKNITYVNGDSGSSVTVSKGTRKTLHASLIGADVEITDGRSLKWTVKGNQIIRLVGGESENDTDGVPVQYVYGENADIEAVGPGECTVTVSHDKAEGNSFTYRVYVPGSGTKALTLSKNYLTLEKGKSAELIANIDGGSKDDYKNIEWTVSEGSSESTVVEKLGSGKQISIYAVNAGTCSVKASYEGSEDECTVKVEAKKSLSFASNSITVQPNGKTELKYFVVPSDAQITWVTSGSLNGMDLFMVTDSNPDGTDRKTENGQGVGTVTVTGVGVGRGSLNGTTIWGTKATCQVSVDWGYQLIPEASNLVCRPGEEITLWYYKSPQGNATTVDIQNPENENWKDYFSKVKDGDIPFTRPDQTTDPEGYANWDETHAGRSFITFKSLKETKAGGVDIVLKLKNSNDPTGNLPQSLVTLNSKLSDITLKLKKKSCTGRFSKITEGNPGIYTITLGDGETLNVDVGFENEEYLTGLKWSVNEVDADFDYIVKSQGWEPSTYIKTQDPTNAQIGTNENLQSPYHYSVKKTSTGFSISNPCDYKAYVYDVTDAWLVFRTVTKNNPVAGQPPIQVEEIVDGWDDDQTVYWGCVSDTRDAPGVSNNWIYDVVGLSLKGVTKEKNPNKNDRDDDTKPELLKWILTKKEDKAGDNSHGPVYKNQTDFSWKKADYSQYPYLKEYLPDEFEHIALWYCPGTPDWGKSETWRSFRLGDNYTRGAYGSGGKDGNGNNMVRIYQGVFSETCTAKYKVSTNTTAVRATNRIPLSIQLSVTHGSETKAVTKDIPLVIEVRGCSMNQN